MPSTPSAGALRRLAQGLFAAACLYTGWRFALFLDWAAGSAGPAVPRPAGVEAFLPIAALAGLKQLVLSGVYDPVHPAGLTVLLAAMASAFVARKGFCGAVCPVGLLSDLLARAGAGLGLERRCPRVAGLLAGCVKYALLAFFLVSILALMDPASTRRFLTSAYNMTADAHLYRLFSSPSGRFLAALGLLGVLGLVVRNAWCRWLCPYGALLGLLGLAGPCGVRHDKASCDGCGRCRRACPMDIEPGRAARSPECVGCGQCVEACPRPGTLGLRMVGRPVRPWAGTALAVGVFATVCLAAMALGRWDNGLPPQMLKALYAQAQHP